LRGRLGIVGFVSWRRLLFWVMLEIGFVRNAFLEMGGMMVNKIKVNKEMFLYSDSVSKECLKEVYESVHQDMWDLMLDISYWNMQDTLLYGYSPWDYIKEIKICIKYSNSTGKVVNEKGI
jgi:hypothetical protein